MRSLPLFSRFDLVLAQNDVLARTLRRLGARRVEAVGNLKIDAPPPVVDAAELDRLRHALGGRPLMVAASRHAARGAADRTNRPMINLLDGATGASCDDRSCRCCCWRWSSGSPS